MAGQLFGPHRPNIGGYVPGRTGLRRLGGNIERGDPVPRIGQHRGDQAEIGPNLEHRPDIQVF